MIFCGDTVFPFYSMDINKMQLEAQKRNYQRRPRGAEKSW